MSSKTNKLRLLAVVACSISVCIQAAETGQQENAALHKLADIFSKDSSTGLGALARLYKQVDGMSEDH
jgi:hypothetical protein